MSHSLVGAGDPDWVRRSAPLRGGSERYPCADDPAARAASSGTKGSLDTGASDCVFDRYYAVALGIDMEAGYRRNFRTVTGSFSAFGHEVTLRCLGLEWSAMVFFHESNDPANAFLGRRGWLDRLKAGNRALRPADPSRTLWSDPLTALEPYRLTPASQFTTTRDRLRSRAGFWPSEEEPLTVRADRKLVVRKGTRVE
jgi:hypothetical protein